MRRPYYDIDTIIKCLIIILLVVLSAWCFKYDLDHPEPMPHVLQDGW